MRAPKAKLMLRALAEAARRRESVEAICRRDGISLDTQHHFRHQNLAEGLDGLLDWLERRAGVR